MPVYEYRCKRCRVRFEAVRPMDECNAPAGCPECGGPGARVISVPHLHKGVWSRQRDPNELLRTKEIWE